MNEPTRDPTQHLTPEAEARDMLENMGVEDAQSFSAGEVVWLANLIVRARPRTFPIITDTGNRKESVKPHPMRIPWSVAEKAWSVYSRHGGRGQPLEEVARRGGFYASEMDLFYPTWREEASEITELRGQVETLRARGVGCTHCRKTWPYDGLTATTEDLETLFQEVEAHEAKCVANPLVQEIARLSVWVADLHGGMYINCVYCGHRYGPQGETLPGTSSTVSAADVLSAHVEQCPKHPLAILRKQLDGVARIVCPLDNNDGYEEEDAEAGHVTPMYRAMNEDGDAFLETADPVAVFSYFLDAWWRCGDKIEELEGRVRELEKEIEDIETEEKE